jgi:7-carboxy-7-deazaguanine synthase
MMQPIQAPDATDEFLRVMEIYPAYQGEGTLVGMPSLFVRLAGCTVGCKWCDTKYSWKANQGTLTSGPALAKVIAGYRLDHVVITGGEPFEHPDSLIADVFRGLYDINWRGHVTFETSGVFWVNPLLIGSFPGRILFSVSPKLPSAQANYEFPNLTQFMRFSANYDCDVQLKFVIGGGDKMIADLRALDRALGYYFEHYSYAMNVKIPIILQPETPFIRNGTPTEVGAGIVANQLALQDALMEITDFVSLNRNVRVLPQLHAILHGNKRGI